MRRINKMAALAARHKMQNNAARVLEQEQRETALARTVLFHLVREQGRVRVAAKDIEALGENDTIDYETDEANGVIMATYRKGT